MVVDACDEDLDEDVLMLVVVGELEMEHVLTKKVYGELESLLNSFEIDWVYRTHVC